MLYLKQQKTAIHKNYYQTIQKSTTKNANSNSQKNFEMFPFMEEFEYKVGE